MTDQAAADDKPGDAAKPVVIKKYANRRLYNTATSSYVTLDHLSQMVRDGVDFVVYDAKSGADITRPVLTQIIVDEEAKGHNLLPVGFLRQLIGFYGHSLQDLVPRYLDYSMHMFEQNQDHMKSYMQEALDGLFPFGGFEEMGRQNMAMFERAMQMFAPFGGAQRPATEQSDKAADAPAGEPARGATAASAGAGGGDNDVLRAMQAQLDAMRKRLDEMAKKSEQS